MNEMCCKEQYFYYSSLSNELKNRYRREIFKFLRGLTFEYRGFWRWYRHLFTCSSELDINREILICEDKCSIIGIAILKRSVEEKKICTLRVSEKFQRRGIGRHLIEASFDFLGTDKPMITLPESRLDQFERILDYYNFELKQSQKHYYNIFNTELVFNGVLPSQHNLLVNKVASAEHCIINMTRGIFANHIRCLGIEWSYDGRM